MLQFDCPENVATYLHRVGRTARFTNAGKALLMLNEGSGEGEKLLADLKTRKVEYSMKKIVVGKHHLPNLDDKLSALLAKHQNIKDLAVSGLKNYLTSLSNAVVAKIDVENCRIRGACRLCHTASRTS